MKITKQYLRKIIKEEVSRTLKEKRYLTENTQATAIAFLKEYIPAVKEKQTREQLQGIMEKHGVVGFNVVKSSRGEDMYKVSFGKDNAILLSPAHLEPEWKAS